MLGLARKHPDLSHRSEEIEWLDGIDINPAALERVLRDLARLNGASLGHHPILSWLHRAVKAAPKDIPLNLVDVGCGYGDLLRAIRRWSRKRRLAINLCGVDLNPETIRIARAATDDADQIDFEIADIFEFHPPMPIDLVVSSLVAHHLSDGMVIEFLRWMESIARRGWLIHDLQRNAILYHLIGLIGRITRLHPMVIHDGQISVTRALTSADWKERIAAAGIPRGTVEMRRFLFRYSLGRLR